MAQAIGFLNAYLVTSLMGLFSWFVIRNLAIDRAAAFGAFCIALGFVVGRYSGSFNPDASGFSTAICQLLGAILALVTMLVLGRVRRKAASGG